MPPRASTRIFISPSTSKPCYDKFRVEPGEKIDGHDTYLVIGRKEGQPPLRLYFDTQTGLLRPAGALCGNSAGPQSHANRLCGLPRIRRSKAAVSLDASAPRQSLHHPGYAAATKRQHRRQQIRAATTGTAAASPGPLDRRQSLSGEGGRFISVNPCKIYISTHRNILYVSNPGWLFPARGRSI